MKPMLAAPTEGLGLTFPLLASPKLDGVRCLIIEGRAMSRSLKPLPNEHVQRLFGRRELDGLDGELIVGDPAAPDVYRRTSSGVMSREGEPDVVFYAFDDFLCDKPFADRVAVAAVRAYSPTLGSISYVEHAELADETELADYEERCLRAGFEGVMLRAPDGPYKHGRSTATEGWLLKLKRFADGEALVLGFQEQLHNANPATVGELGQKKRSSHKAGKQPTGQLGALQVQDCLTGVQFSVGSGFTQAERSQLWEDRRQLVGRLVKYKSQPTGVKEAPRFPIFLGFRDPTDM